MKIGLVIIDRGTLIDTQLEEVAGFLNGNRIVGEKVLFLLKLKGKNSTQYLIPEEIHEFYILELDQITYTENCIEALVSVCINKPCDAFMFCQDDFSKELCIRMGYRLNGKVYIGIKKIEYLDESWRIHKRVYSNNALAQITEKSSPCLVTMEKGFKGKIKQKKLMRAQTVCIPTRIQNWKIAASPLIPAERNGIDKAKKIVVVGNGVDKKNIVLVEKFAKIIGAELAGTRAAAEKGLIGIKQIIGISGHIVAPEMCLVLGVSGMAAFVAGIEKSKIIISVNTDSEAPIFRISNYGYVKDYKVFIKHALKWSDDNV